MLIDLLHWAFLAVALLISLRIFRDLADLSQWVVQTPPQRVSYLPHGTLSSLGRKCQDFHGRCGFQERQAKFALPPDDRV